jgi:hypothetical protein
MLFLPGMERLNSTKLTIAAANTSVLTIPARDILVVIPRVTGYGGADIASLRFNGDTGANYWSKPSSAAAATTAMTVAAASVSQAVARMFSATTTLGRSGCIIITNNATTEKIGSVSGATGSGAAATGGTLEENAFGWVNTSAQITTIQMLTAGGQTLLAGSGFIVFGANF